MVVLTTLKLIATVPSKRTPVEPVKLVPLIVTAVPPAIGPPAGDTPATVGAAV